MMNGDRFNVAEAASGMKNIGAPVETQEPDKKFTSSL